MIRYSPISGIAAAALFIALAVSAMAPVLTGVHDRIPGSHLGDNATGLWNVWWFTQAIADGQTPYRTDRLFAPFGTQLSLHTHATTHSLLAWLLTWFTPLVAAHNLAILTGLALNGICAWLLAYRVTRRMLPSLLGGVIFSLSAHVQLRVLGHINMVHAWVLPLFALTVLRLEDRRRFADAVLAGAAGAIVLYTDYYYAVYAAMFCGVWAAVRTLAVEGAIGPSRLHHARRVLLALIAVDLALIVAVAWTGGTGLEVGPIRISARSMRNPLTALWILSIAWSLLRFPPTISLRVQHRPAPQSLRLALVSFGTFLLLGAPLLLALARVITSGDYTAPSVLWRSSPAGADALTLVLGHPLHFLTATWTQSAYEALEIDMMEGSLWLGLVPLALLLATWRQWWKAPAARLWVAVAILFFVLALGPFLRVGGFDTALPLPHAVLRYVPGFGNARIPGRAVVMVDLAVAVLTALVLSKRTSGARGGALVLAALVIIENFPAPAPAAPLPKPDSIDELLRSSVDQGAVVELPTGLRDGFGEHGALDHRSLIRQIRHGRPLVGGFVARLSSDVREQYESEPILRNLLDVSTPGKQNVQLIPDAAERARELGITYLILNRDTWIDERLPTTALQDVGFRLLQKSGTRELYSSTLSTRAP